MVPLMRGVDVSHWNGNVDFNALKRQGVKFAMIKAGGHEKVFYRDAKFITNYNAAKEAGVYVGAYYFVGNTFTNSTRGIKDAEHFLNIIKGKEFEFPICVDVEVTPLNQKTGATEATIAFCKTIEKAGYYCNIYASDISGFMNRLELSKLTPFDLWVARYGSAPKYVKKYGMWQYTNTGRFSQNKGNFDLNYAYKDYPSIMKRAGLNGY